MCPSLERAAVIGAGPIGCASAGRLSLAGLQVSLYDVDPAAVEPVQRTGRVRLTGVLEGEAPIRLASTDAEAVVREAQLVVCAVPASVHEQVARSVANALSDGCLLLIQPGQTLSAVAFLHAARQAGLRSDLVIVETLNTLFTARLVRPGEVEVFALKASVPFAGLPADRMAWAGKKLQPLFENLIPAGSLLEVDLHNFNAILHPPITLLNAGMIDSGQDFLFYMQGSSPKVMELVEVLDRERLSILDGLGLPGFSLLTWFDRAYGVRRDRILDAVLSTGPYSSIAAPNTIQTRLLLEDVPTGLVPYCSLAEVAGAQVPVMRSVVELCGALYGMDFWSTGRTLARFGLGDLDAHGLKVRLGSSF